MAITPKLLFTPKEMAAVDAAAIHQGIAGYTLMDRAGLAIARLCQSLRGPGSVYILCGPGNNGGDGYVAAKYLQDVGWEVRLWAACPPEKLIGDAGEAAQQCPIAPRMLDSMCSDDTRADICIDALFGAGLGRPLDGALARQLLVMLEGADTCIAVDLPSGLCGNTGQVLGDVYAETDRCFDHTITFGARKFGHVLYPGKALCGELWIADIGLTLEALEAHRYGALISDDALKKSPAAFPTTLTHKYKRGHVGVVSGGNGRAGAARLAASAALRAGAGLVTLIEPDETGPSQDGGLNALMHASISQAEDLHALCQARKISTLVIG
ncbi:MAG: NAD(P)H-hydrate epimerase, partial [Pseudomonadota bacterium]